MDITPSWQFKSLQDHTLSLSLRPNKAPQLGEWDPATDSGTDHVPIIGDPHEYQAIHLLYMQGS